MATDVKKAGSGVAGSPVTAEELGAAVGTSSSAINMYECGQRVPRDDIKIKIAEFFGLSVESIFYPIK